MLGAVTWVNKPPPVISVGRLSQHLIIGRYTSVPALVIVLPLLLLQLLLLPLLREQLENFKPAMVKFHQEHQAYKFKVAVSIVVHKAIDPDVVTPVVLASEMVAVYTDALLPRRESTAIEFPRGL